MFNLEQSIAEWRRQMLAAGIKTLVVEELESHLREEFERQMQSGLNAQQAFEIAAKEIGCPPELKREFKKMDASMEMQKIIKLAGVICVAVALFCPLCICIPSCFNILSDRGFSLMTRVLPLPILTITFAATILCWKYNQKLLPVIRNQRLRRAVGMVCFVGCLLWIRFVLFHFPTENILLDTFLFGSEWTVMAILGGIGHGLEKAAHRQTTIVDS